MRGAKLGSGSGAGSQTATQTIADLDVVGQPFELTRLGFNPGLIELVHEMPPVRGFRLLFCLAGRWPVWTDHHSRRALHLSQTSLRDCRAAAPATVIQQNEPLPFPELGMQMSPRRMPARIPVIQVNDGDEPLHRAHAADCTCRAPGHTPGYSMPPLAKRGR